MSDDAPEKFEHSSMQTAQSIGAYLEALSKAIRSGALRVGAGDQSLELRPSGVLGLEVKAKRDDGRGRLSLRVEWHEEEEGPDVHPLTIEHGEDPNSPSGHDE
jgi:amphi-Trp domain-containing protein